MTVVDDITAITARQDAQIDTMKRSWTQNIPWNGKVLACGLLHADNDAANAARARINADIATQAEARRQLHSPNVGWTHRGRTILALEPRDGALHATCAVFSLAAQRPREPRKVCVTLADQALEHGDPRLLPSTQTIVDQRIRLLCAWLATTDLEARDAQTVLAALPDLVGRRWSTCTIPADHTYREHVTAAGAITTASLVDVGMLIHSIDDARNGNEEYSQSLRVHGGVVLSVSQQPTGTIWAVLRWGATGLEIGHVHQSELHVCPAGTTCFWCPSPARRIKATRRKIFGTIGLPGRAKQTLTDRDIVLLHAELLLRKAIA
jgi:hypothetical protein